MNDLTIEEIEKTLDDPENIREVAVICSSRKFEDYIPAISRELTLKGYRVFTLHVFDDNISEEEQYNLVMMHYQNILICDFIYVVNIDGYIGESVKQEIEFAKNHGKQVIYHLTNNQNIMEECARNHICKSMALLGITDDYDDERRFTNISDSSILNKVMASECNYVYLTSKGLYDDDGRERQVELDKDLTIRILLTNYPVEKIPQDDYMNISAGTITKYKVQSVVFDNNKFQMPKFYEKANPYELCGGKGLIPITKERAFRIIMGMAELYKAKLDFYEALNP